MIFCPIVFVSHFISLQAKTFVNSRNASTQKVLNISSNRIDNLEFCASLTKLKNLKCEDNRLNSITELQYLKNCKKLSKVKEILLANRHVYIISINNKNRFQVCFRGNPIAKEKRYRDSVILNVEAIESLDEKEVKKNEVAFIRNWNQFKIDKESKTNLLAEARSKRNQLGYSDLDTVFSKSFKKSCLKILRSVF